MTFPHPIPYSVLKTHGIANTENSIVLKTICSVTSSLTEWICLSFCRLRLIYDCFSVNPNLQFKVDKRMIDLNKHQGGFIYENKNQTNYCDCDHACDLYPQSVF